MNIEQQWQAAKEEFKDNAFKRFKIYHHGYGELDAASNEQIESVISQNPTRDFRDILKIKSLPELFAHDVEVYGENAYLMWEIKYSKIPIPSNDEIINALSAIGINKLLQRKKSAALPFDLERAKAGDVVEWFDKTNWINCTFNLIAYDYIPKNEYHLLRMKYPPKLKK